MKYWGQIVVVLCAVFRLVGGQGLAAEGDGTLAFANIGGPVNAPVKECNTNTPLAAGATAELWVGSSRDNLRSVGNPTPFLTNGFFSAGTREVPFPAGTTVFVQVKAKNGALTGESNIFQIVLGGGGTPPQPPSSLAGLKAFTVCADATPPQPEPEPEPSLSLTPGSRSFNAGGGASSFQVSSNVSWTWRSDANWLTSTESRNQNGNQTFSYRVGAQTSTNARQGRVTIEGGGKTVVHTISQSGVVPVIEGGGSLNFSNLGSGVNAPVTICDSNEVVGPAASAQLWVGSSRDALSQVGGSTGFLANGFFSAGARTVPFPPGSAVFAQIRVEQGDLLGESNIIQVRLGGGGTPPEPPASLAGLRPFSICAVTPEPEPEPEPFLRVVPGSRSMDSEGGTSSFSVQSNTDWRWLSSVNWISSRESNAQSGNQAFDYQVASNPSSDSRVGQVIVQAGGLSAVHTINQAGRIVPTGGKVTFSSFGVGVNAAVSICRTGELVGSEGQVELWAGASRGALTRIGDPISILSRGRFNGGVLAIPGTRPGDRVFVQIRARLGDLSGQSNVFEVVLGGGNGNVPPASLTSLASFEICGEAVAPEPTLSVDPKIGNFGPEGGSGNVRITANGDWNWNSSVNWISSRESRNQSGDQAFGFQVASNPSNASRVGVIAFQSGGLSALVQVTQAARSTPDPEPEPEPEPEPIPVDLDAGQLLFANIGSGFSAPVTVCQTGVPLGAGAFAELWAGPSPRDLALAGRPVPFLQNGFFSGGTAFVPETVPGQSYFIQVRAKFGDLSGASEVLEVVLGGDGTPPSPPTVLTDLKAFSVCEGLPEPEPEPDPVLSVAANLQAFPAEGGDGEFRVSSNGNWVWRSSVPWIQSNEGRNQNGDQVFDYEVAPNESTAGRVGQIILQSGPLTAIHSVNQAGREVRVPGQVRFSNIGANVFAPVGICDSPDLLGRGAFAELWVGSSRNSLRLVGQAVEFGGNGFFVGSEVRVPDSLPGDTRVAQVRARFGDLAGASNVFELVLGGGDAAPALLTGLERFNVCGELPVVEPEPEPFLNLSQTGQAAEARGGSFSVGVESNADWTWSSNAGWITSNEARPQNGNQTFSFSVAPNDGANPRTGNIRFQSGALSRVFEVRQVADVVVEGGEILFGNIGLGLLAPVGVCDSNEMLGSDATAELWVGRTRTSLERVGEPVPFLQRGFFSAGTMVVPGTEPGQRVFVQVRAAKGDLVGESNIFQLTLGGQNTPPTPPTALFGLESFDVCEGEVEPFIRLSSELESIGAPGGELSIMVESNDLWLWRDNASWIASEEGRRQEGRQEFTFQVEANETFTSRSGKISFRSLSGTVVLEVVQGAAADPDGGQILFANIGSGIRARVTECETGTPLAEGATAELWAGKSPDELFQVGEPAPFIRGGFFSDNERIVPGTRPGETVFAQVRARSGDLVGVSNIVEIELGGFKNPPSPASALVGLEPFEVCEETSGGLGQLSLAADSRGNATLPGVEIWSLIPEDLDGERRSILLPLPSTEGVGAASFRLERSSDLSDWDRVDERVLSDGAAWFLEVPVELEERAEFYRLVPLNPVLE